MSSNEDHFGEFFEEAWKSMADPHSEMSQALALMDTNQVYLSLAGICKFAWKRGYTYGFIDGQEDGSRDPIELDFEYSNIKRSAAVSNAFTVDELEHIVQLLLYFSSANDPFVQDLCAKAQRMVDALSN